MRKKIIFIAISIFFFGCNVEKTIKGDGKYNLKFNIKYDKHRLDRIYSISGNDFIYRINNGKKIYMHTIKKNSIIYEPNKNKEKK